MLLPDGPVLDAAGSEPPGPARRALLRGIGWTTLDQAISSCTNFGVAVVAARELSRDGFGAFGLAISLSIFILGVARSLGIEPLLSRPELAIGARQRETFGKAAGAVLASGCLASVGVVIAGVLLGAEIGRALFALAIVLPGLSLQDAWRYCFISQGRGSAAALNGGIWLVAQVATVIVLAASSHWSPTAIILAWGGAGSLAGVIGTCQAHVRPRPIAGFSWLAEQRDIGGRYCLEFVISNGATQVALLGLGAIAGLSALGAVRAGQTFFGPLGILFTGMLLAVVPTASTLRSAPVRLHRLLMLISVSVCVGSAVWTLFGMALPDGAGKALFGETWSATRQVILPLGLTFFASGVAAGPFAGLRALAAAREGLRARLLTLPVIVGAPLAGAAASGAAGFSYGLAGATVVMAGIYWRQFTLASARSAVPRSVGGHQHRDIVGHAVAEGDHDLG